jgi:hypothetical protein
MTEERPPPDPAKLLGFWMDWERGETPPGMTLSNLKREGLRELLESTVRAQQELTGEAPKA